MHFGIVELMPESETRGSEMRWDPFLREWVVIAAHRGARPVLAEKADKSYRCPFCPDAPEGQGDWVVKHTNNKFAAMTPEATLSPEILQDTLIFKVKASVGVNEVILYTREHNQQLGSLSLDHITQLVQLWADRYAEIGKLDVIKSVFIFENRGTIIGVSLSHPHGQLYGFPFIPPRFQRQLDGAQVFHEEHSRCLYCEVLANELKIQRRIVCENEDFVAFCPPYAKWDYETHIYPRRHIPSLFFMTLEERHNYAAIIKQLVQKLDRFHPNLEFMPYTMGLYQQPTDGGQYPYFHLNMQFYPAMRGANQQKFAGSVESHMGTWINSSAPEDVARMLRGIKSDLD
ncbi:MAG: galactose-1-phosphate uridylyltransferase [Promethearchaeota archaeon CR_4]|nr:MAG: galactose-1-phosphate uridylyltransferase [Candidatus Lokiarchaeota archaeon CR_4]